MVRKSRTSLSLEEAYQNMMMSEEVDLRAEAQREMVIRLAEETQFLAARLRSLIMFLAPMLPQPTAQPDDRARRLGTQAAGLILEALQQAFVCRVDQVVGNSPFGLTQLMPVLVGLSPVAIEIMTFPEGAELVLQETETDEEAMAAFDWFPEYQGPSDHNATYGIGMNESAGTGEQPTTAGSVGPIQDSGPTGADDSAVRDPTQTTVTENQTHAVLHDQADLPPAVPDPAVREHAEMQEKCEQKGKSKGKTKAKGKTKEKKKARKGASPTKKKDCEDDEHDEGEGEAVQQPLARYLNQ